MSKETNHQDNRGGLDSCMKEARRLFMEHWIAFALERDAGNSCEVTKLDRASALGERMAAKKYEELKSLLLDLLPWVGPMKPAEPTAQGRSYDVVEFEGMEAPRHIRELKKRGKEASIEIKHKAQLEWMRTFGERVQAWEAFCSVLSISASRAEMSWTELFCIANEIEYKLKKVPGCTSKGSAKRKAWIRQFLLNQAQYGCGNFVGFMTHVGCTIRVAFVSKPGVPRHIPASVVILCS